MRLAEERHVREHTATARRQHQAGNWSDAQQACTLVLERRRVPEVQRIATACRKALTDLDRAIRLDPRLARKQRRKLSLANVQVELSPVFDDM